MNSEVGLCPYWNELWAAIVVHASNVLRHLTSSNNKRKPICSSLYTIFNNCCLTGSGSLSRKQIAEIFKYKVGDSTCEAATLIFCQWQNDVTRLHHWMWNTKLWARLMCKEKQTNHSHSTKIKCRLFLSELDKKKVSVIMLLLDCISHLSSFGGNVSKLICYPLMFRPVPSLTLANSETEVSLQSPVITIVLTHWCIREGLM